MADSKLEVKKAESKKKDSKKQSKKSNKPNLFKGLIKYLNSCKGELKKITWPTQQPYGHCRRHSSDTHGATA